MRFPTRFSARASTALLALIAAAAVARAETWKLELKRLDKEDRSNSDYSYRATYPQGFFAQLVNNALRPGDPRQTQDFKRIVKKEPKYQSATPFRGVARLGSQEFAFVLDGPPPAKETKPDVKEDKKKEGEKAKPESPTGKLAEKITKAPGKKATAGAIRYNRLYFDLNHNGDLTDDKPINVPAEDSPREFGGGRSHASFRFPQIDLTIDVDGTKVDYAFIMNGNSMSQPNFSYVSLSLNAAAYRAGDITLAGKKHHVVVIDFNSNGRFSDEVKLTTVNIYRGGKVVSESQAEQGDMLLLDPAAEGDSPYTVTESNCRHHMSKLISIDGQFYSVRLSPAGDKLTLEPSSAAFGRLSNPNSAFRAVVYGDAGFLKISGDKETPAAVPEGEWKLLSYTIRSTEAEKAKKAEGDKKTPEMTDTRRLSFVTAEIGGDYKAVKVVKGETAALPFGPPYKPMVAAEYFQDGPQRKTLSLSLALVGSAGETCSDMAVNGGRPSKPSFTITDAKGKVIQEGNFEYG
jgi:hypothetical protein